jgi:hypothetical protein
MASADPISLAIGQQRTPAVRKCYQPFGGLVIQEPSTVLKRKWFGNFSPIAGQFPRCSPILFVPWRQRSPQERLVFFAGWRTIWWSGDGRAVTFFG